MLGDADLDSSQKAELALEAAALAKSIETEGKIENLIKAIGLPREKICTYCYDGCDPTGQCGCCGCKKEEKA